MPLKYLSNFWRSLEAALINCKIELKLKWTRYCVLSVADSDNDNANCTVVISTIKDTKLYVPVITLSARDNEKLSKFIGFERSIKQKLRIKIRQINKDSFLNQTLLIDYLFYFFQLKMANLKLKTLKRFKAKRHYLPKDIIKSYDIIVNVKIFGTKQLIMIYNNVNKLGN